MSKFKKRMIIFLLVIVVCVLCFGLKGLLSPKIVIEGDFAKDNHVQVFYDIGNGFVENDSATVHTNLKMHKITIDLPNKAIASFRIDLGNNPNEVILDGITITGGFKKIKLSPETILSEFDVQNQLNATQIESNRLVITSTLKDPYIYNSTGELGINAGHPIFRLTLIGLTILGVLSLCLSVLLVLLVLNKGLHRLVIQPKAIKSVCVLFVVLLTGSTSFNMFRLADNMEFNYAKNDNHGTFGTILSIKSEGLKYYGLETRYDITHGELEQYDVHAAQSDYYFDEVEVNEEDIREIYLSRSNIRGMFYGVVDVVLSWFNIPPMIKFNLYVIGSNVTFALALLIILRWINFEFGRMATALSAGVTLTAKYLIIAGASLDNAMISLILPLVVTVYILYKEKTKGEKTKPWVEFGLVFLTILLKALEGYEFIPAVMVALTVPYLYYWVREKQSFKLFIVRFITVSFAAITAVIAALGIHFAQLTALNGTAGAKQALLHAFFKRTYGSQTFQLQEAEALAPSLNSSIFKNLMTYINMDVCFNMSVGDLLIFLGITLGACVIGTLVIKKKNLPLKMWATLVLTAVSFFAMLSTLIVFKGHSYIHIHQTARVWFVPFMLMVMALIGLLIEQIRDIVK